MRDADFLDVACRRTEELFLRCDGATTIARDADVDMTEVAAQAMLLKALAGLSVEVGSCAGATGAVSSKAMAALEANWAAQAPQMSFGDVERALTAFAKSGMPADGLLPAARKRVLDVLRGAGELPETRPLLGLVGYYFHLGRRDGEVLNAVLDALVAKGNGSDAVLGHSLPQLVRALVSPELRPPPASLARLLVLRLPLFVHKFSVPNLVLVVPALGLMPGMRKTSLEFRRAVFNACLAAPLSVFRPPALVSILRSALVLHYADPEFLASALRQIERSLLEHGDAWRTDHIARAALLAARVLAVAGRAEPSSTGSISTAAPPPRANAIAAESVVMAAAAAAEPRVSELAPHDIGVLAIAHAKAKVENGSLFAGMTHRSMELLEAMQPPDNSARAGRRLRRAIASEASFQKRDVAQLLAALATFDYREDSLLTALALRAQGDWDEYDVVAKDIVLWAVSKLGGLPGASTEQLWPVLSDALLEYELSKGRGEVSDQARDHLLSIEVLPADE